MRSDVVTEALSQLSDEYTFLNPDGTQPADAPPRALAEAGSSVVYRALQNNRLTRALKILVAPDDSPVALTFPTRNFETEVSALAELSHEGIARLTGFGPIPGMEQSNCAYIATEYVDGQTLTKFAQDDETDGSEILEALDQILEAVAYLHERQVLHSDLKEDNIVIASRVVAGRRQLRAVVLDLGVSHALGASTSLEGQARRQFHSTPEYVIPGLRLALANHAIDQTISVEDLRRFFPSQDHFALGVILEHLTGDHAIRRKLLQALGSRGLDALRRVQSRLASLHDDVGHYATVVEVREALSRLAPEALAPLGIPDLNRLETRGIVLSDATGRIATSARVDSIVSHPLFQRLHHLNQLDLLQYVLPGATQSRFQHAIRQFDLARRAVSSQLTNWEFRLDVERSDIDHTLTAALLDSVGRYQMQHMFEDFLAWRGQIPDAGLKTSSELLSAIMEPQDDPLGAVLSGVRDRRGRTFAQAAQTDWHGVLNLKERPADRIQGFLSALLDSPVDVNKLAYLRQDSLAAGLPFGRAIDPEALFDFLRLPEEKEWKESGVGRRAILGLREDGLPYAEAAILIRYWSIKTGYWNRTNRALQAMVKYVIAALLRSGRFEFHDYLLATLHNSANEALRYLSDKFDAAVREKALPADSVNPIAELSDSQRNAYMRFMTISPKSDVGSRSGDDRIYDAARRNSPLQDERFCSRVVGVIEQFEPGLGIRPGEVLLDLPRARRDDSVGRILVYADEPGAEYLGELGSGSHSVSPLLGDNLATSMDLYVKRLRIFVHPRIYRALGSRAEKAHQEALDSYRDAVERGEL